MMIFGFLTLIDALSWFIAIILSLKVAATLFLLGANKNLRDKPGWGSALWWVTKITPVIAAPCFVWIALLQGSVDLILISLALILFVAIAVPLKIYQRRTRIAKQMSAKPLM
jgi:hypothetical protein